MAQILSPEQSSRIAILRDKILNGSISLEEQQEIVRTMREGRMEAAAAETKSKKSAKAAIPDGKSLLEGL